MSFFFLKNTKINLFHCKLIVQEGYKFEIGFLFKRTIAVLHVEMKANLSNFGERKGYVFTNVGRVVLLFEQTLVKPCICFISKLWSLFNLIAKRKWFQN